MEQERLQKSEQKMEKLNTNKNHIQGFIAAVSGSFFSKKTGMLFSLSCRMYFRQSGVLRANRLMDFVMNMSMLPTMHSSITRLH